jgi:dihydrolipoamide dehydrogenase
VVSAEKIFVATGSRPVELPMAGFDHELIWDSSDAVTTTELPESIVIVGGGYIGIEFACIYAACGVEVTVVEMLDTILPFNDPDCAQLVLRRMKKAGAKVMTGAALEGVEKKDGSVVARLAGGEQVEAQKMLVSVGRKPDCSGLAVENAGLEPAESGELAVNGHMQTAVPHIYAIGDVAGAPLLAHAGSHEGVTAAAHATGTITAEMDYRTMPACVFSLPEVASVGMMEADARERFGQENITVKKFPFLALGKAHIHGATDGFVKMVARAGGGRILGVHICGEGAGLLIGEAAVAVRLECTAEELAHTIHAHPTMPEALHEAAEGVLGMPINWRG